MNSWCPGEDSNRARKSLTANLDFEYTLTVARKVTQGILGWGESGWEAVTLRESIHAKFS